MTYDTFAKKLGDAAKAVASDAPVLLLSSPGFGWELANNTGQTIYLMETQPGEYTVGVPPTAALVKAAGTAFASGAGIEGGGRKVDVWAILGAGNGTIYPRGRAL